MVPGAGIECMVKSLVLYDKNISNKFMYPQKYPQLILLPTRATMLFSQYAIPCQMQSQFALIATESYITEMTETE